MKNGHSSLETSGKMMIIIIVAEVVRMRATRLLNLYNLHNYTANSYNCIKPISRGFYFSITLHECVHGKPRKHHRHRQPLLK